MNVFARFSTVPYPRAEVVSVACKGVTWGVQYLIDFGGGQSSHGSAHEPRSGIARRRRPDPGSAGRGPSGRTVSDYAPVPELSEVHSRAHARRGKRPSS